MPTAPISLKFVALKTIETKGHAYNEDITRAVIALRDNGLGVRPINFHYTPGGPCSPEVESTLGVLLNQEEIAELSPAKITPKGEVRLSKMESELTKVSSDVAKVRNIILKS